MSPLTWASKSTTYIGRFGLLSALLLLAFVVAFGSASWRSAQSDNQLRLETVLSLSEKALDRYFVQTEAGLLGLARSLQEGGGLSDLALAQRKLKGYHDLHPEAIAVALIALDGQMLTASTTSSLTGLPFLGNSESFKAFLAAQTPTTSLRLGRPAASPVDGKWVFPMRLTARDAQGRAIAFVTESVPVEMLQGFWREAPMTEGATMGLLRDDGYLLSRYPVPAGRSPAEVYGAPRTGTLSTHLAKSGFPKKGYVEGLGAFSGDQRGYAFMRLEHFPVTLFVSTPLANLRSAWWERVRVAYGLVALIALVGFAGQRHAQHRQRAWDEDRRRAAAGLVASEQEQRYLIDHLIAGVLVYGPDSTIVRCNPLAIRMFGIDEASMKGSTLVSHGTRLLREDGSDLPEADYPVSRAVRERRSLRSNEIGVLLPGAVEPTWLMGNVEPEFDAEGRLLRVVASFVDISARRQAEAARAAQQRAENANRAKSEFVARMSHELRTPMNAILGFADVLQLDRKRPLDATQREHVRHIHRAGKHLLSVIEDLLDLSRIETGDMHLVEGDLAPLEVVNEVMSELAGRAEAAGVALAVKLPSPPIGVIRGDRTRIKQVLLNLVSNAIKYNRRGGRVEVVLRGQPADPARVVFEVSDTGLGMTPEQLETLFQPFNRLGREGSGVEGTGIGLVITRNLVEVMGGVLAVESTPAVGSRFRAELPWVAGRADAVQEDAVPLLDESGEQGSVRVLYIDDDPINCLLVESLLELRPDVVLAVAADGPEGLALARSFQPDLVMTDMMMPSMTGLEVLRALRADAGIHPARCIAVSASAMPEQIDSALAAGFDGYLTKPLPAGVLYPEIDRLRTMLARQA